MVRLLYMPKALYVRLEPVEGASESCPTEWILPRACLSHIATGADPNCEQCKSFRHCVVVPPVTNPKPWSLEIETKEIGQVKVRVKRTQLPVVSIKGSTLHVLQGTTCDPGLIFHWALPNRLMLEQKWLAVYVALSRVRNLKSLRSIGLNKKIKHIIEWGSFRGAHGPAQFEKYFGVKEKQTLDMTVETLRKLGWSSS